METPDISSGNVGGLLAFMDFMISKGYASAGAISPWKSAARQVFSTVEGDDYEDFDIKSLDVDEYFGRFENRSMGKYSAGSLSSYRARFRRAVDAYRSYLADPNWKPVMRRPTQKAGDAAEGSKKRSVGSKKPQTGPVERAKKAAAPSSPALMTYPFPLKSGQVAQLHLPTKLDPDDAERLTQFVRALVFEQPRRLGAGSGRDGS
jgi:hypothetical protein